MCDLFGMSCNSRDRAPFSLKKFENLSRVNPDGWGVAYYDKNGKATITTSDDGFIAANDPKYKKAYETAKSNIIIAHLRRATDDDEPCKEKCHPFGQKSNGRDWVFAHNGQIKGIEIPIGKIDSECAFELIINNIKKCTLSQNIGINTGIYPGIIKGIQYIFDKYGNESNLNFLMSDGTLLYAFHHHSNEKKKMYFVKRSKKVYGNAFLVSTSKTLFYGEDCEEMPPDRLLVICNGEILILSDKL